MYLSHYGLDLKPFDINPDPRFLWLSETHKEALASLRYGIQEDKGFLLLTGDVGSGKTVLINCLTKNIDIKVIVATIPDPGLSLIDFYNILADEFKMGRTFTQKGDFLIHFKKFLIGAAKTDKKVLLIIDEAQRLDPGLLDEVRVLSNIDLYGQMLICIFLVGQNELREMLLEERNRPFRQRISVHYNIDPLNEKETFSFIEHRLKVAGATRRFFTEDAMREVYTFSNGFPRLINVICDHALMSGYSAGATMIDGRIVKECANELQIKVAPAVQPLKEKAPIPYQPPVQPSTVEEYEIVPEDAPRASFIRIADFIVIGIFFIGFIFSLFRTSETEQSSELAKLDTKTAAEKSLTREGSKQPPETAISDSKTKDVPKSSASIDDLEVDENNETTDSNQRQSEKDNSQSETEAIAQKDDSDNQAPVKEFTEIEQPEMDEKSPAGQAISETEVLPPTNQEEGEKKSDKVPQTIASNNELAEAESTESLLSSLDDEESSTVSPPTQESITQNELLSVIIPDNKLIILFERDSTEIDSEHLEILTKVAEYLSQAPEINIIVEGYTDIYGNIYYNQQLSQLRANVVKSYFVGQGIEYSRISAIGLGPDNPIGDNRTREGRSKNRRVEIRVVPAAQAESAN